MFVWIICDKLVTSCPSWSIIACTWLFLKASRILWRWVSYSSTAIVGDKSTGCLRRTSYTPLSSLLLGFLFASLVAFNRWFKLYSATSSHIPFLFLNSWASACLSSSSIRPCRSSDLGDPSLISTRSTLLNLWLVRNLRFWCILNLLFRIT